MGKRQHFFHNRVRQFAFPFFKQNLRVFIDIRFQAAPPGKRHFRQRGKQAAVAAVVVGKQFAFLHQLLNHVVKLFQVACFDVGRFAAQFAVYLR